MKVAIIGAGLIGVTSAYFLSKKGYTVTVYEREASPAMKCSRANGSQISVCNSETWHTWKNIQKGLKWMLSKDAPLLIRPAPSISKIYWLAGFLRHTLNGSHEKNTIRTINLAKKSSDIYQRIIHEEGLQFDQSNCGILHVYSNEKSFEQALSSKNIFEENGVEWKYLSADEIRSKHGMLEYKNLYAGFLTSTDWTGDAHTFTSKLQRACISRGVEFIFNADVIGVSGKNVKYKKNGCDECHASSYDAVILCNGHEMQKWSILHGDLLNIYPVKGYSITIPGAVMAPDVSLLDDERKIVCSKLGDKFRVAGTAELDGNNLDIRYDRIKPLLDWTRDNFPLIDTSNYTPWACLRPMSSDMLPLIRKSKSDGLWYHGGHGHLGWTLGAATSQRLAEVL